MRTFFKFLVIGWSIACIGVFIISYKEMKFGSQSIKVELEMLKPDVGAKWMSVLKVESFNEPPGVVPEWFKDIAKQNPKTVVYRETNSIEGNFYILLPMYCFGIWAIPILVFSIIGILFAKKG